MQLLYMLNRDEQLQFTYLVKLYNEGIWKTYELYIFQLYLFLKVTQQAEQDAINRAAKYLPSESDKVFLPNLYKNTHITALANHKGFLALVTKYKANEDLDDDLIRKMYQAFGETEEYRIYKDIVEPTDSENSKILIELYRFLSTNDLFLEVIEDRYLNMSDDESLVNGTMKKTIKDSRFKVIFTKSTHLLMKPSANLGRRFCAKLARKTKRFLQRSIQCFKIGMQNASLSWI